jgi:hypothetical protein
VVNLRRPDGTLLFGPGSDDPVARHLQELLERGQAAGELGRFDPMAMALVHARGRGSKAYGRRHLRRSEVPAQAER